MTASSSIHITYVPADCGSVIPGKSKAPQAFRDVGLAQKLRHAGISSVKEFEALDRPAAYEVTDRSSTGVRNEGLNVEVCDRVRQTIAKNLEKQPEQPGYPLELIIGGECCMIPGILTAYWHQAESQSPRRRVGLLYIDADADLGCPTDPKSSGTFASMNMTHCMGLEGKLPSMQQFCRVDGQPLCDASNTVFFGMNVAAVDSASKTFGILFDNDYKVVTSTSVSQDPEKRARAALEHLEKRVDVIVVHLDLDSIDPGTFPLANVPNYTGVTYQKMMRALKIIMMSDKVGGLIIAEANPDHDPGLKMVGKLTDDVAEIFAVRTHS